MIQCITKLNNNRSKTNLTNLTNRQTNKQTNKQTGKQTDKQANKQRGKQTNRQTNKKQTNKPRRVEVTATSVNCEVRVYVKQLYRSRYDKPPLTARCCHVANKITNFTDDR